MKAALFTGIEKIEVQEVQVPVLQPGQVLIKNMACGVCGTDVHILHGEPGSADVTPPVILGHEYAGIVEKVGEGVDALQAGDHVTVDPNIYCGVCESCRMGKKQMCESMQAIGVTQNGGFAQYSVVPASQVFKLDKNVPFADGAMTEPLACCIHGIDLLQIKPGETVCVIGGGAIGLILLQLAKQCGASFVTLSEPNVTRRKAAQALGADYVLDPLNQEEVTAYLKTHGGADKIIECAGNRSAVQSAIQFAKKGGTILLFSVPKPDAVAEFPLFDIFKKELTIKGSFVNPDTHLRAVNLINQGRLDFEPIITHRFGIEDTEKAIRAQMGEDSVKVIVCAEEMLSENGFGQKLKSDSNE